LRVPAAPHPHQYLLGDALLVAPVVEPGVEHIDIYVPEGEWTDLWEGAHLIAPMSVKAAAPRDRIPVLIRETDGGITGSLKEALRLVNCLD
jgi:alpha-glucosidase (family GH31 glycosyl hydrolase)